MSDVPLSDFQKKVLEITAGKTTVDGDVTDEAYDRIKKLVGVESEQPVKFVDVRFKKEEKISVYQSILQLAREKARPEQIAQSIMIFLNEYLDDKYKESTAKELKGPVFRRSE